MEVLIMKFKIKIPDKVDKKYIYIANVILAGNFEDREIKVDMNFYKGKDKEIALSLMGTFVSMIPKKWLVKIGEEN